MSHYTKNRKDPYINFQFRIKINNKTVAGFSNMSKAQLTIERIDHRVGDNPHIRKTLGRLESNPIILERGITIDKNFHDWAKSFFNLETKHSLADSKKNFVIEFINESGITTHSYKITNCWVSDYNALEKFDSKANTIMIESIKLECEGWARI